MPTSEMKAVPPARIWWSAVGTWVWVPTTRRGAAVAEMAHRLLLAGRLAMHVDDDGVGRLLERAGRELAIDRRKRVVERVHEDAAHHVDHEHARAVRASISAAPRPGVPGGKLIGRNSRGSRSMKTSASFWSQE